MRNFFKRNRNMQAEFIIKNRVSEFRTDKGISQKELADNVGISIQTLKKIEDNTYSSNVSILLASKIAFSLDQQVDHIFQLDYTTF